jgi:transcription initiation factor IIE alpha subunit
MSSTAIAERLVATVARAFYTDAVIVILDALVREKYLREDEFGPRLKLPDKDVKKILNQLHEEMLLRVQDVTMEDGRPSRCWYIDYQLFVHVVRYRVHLIQSEITAELNDIFFQCPTCKEKYSELTVQRLISKDLKFICGRCCPFDNFRETVSEPYFRLVEHDRGAKFTEVQLLSKKIEEQMNSASGLHSGIYDLLSDLRDENIIRNLPSENIKRGIKSSRITDDEVLQRIQESAALSGNPGAKRSRKAMEEGGIAEEDMPIDYAANTEAPASSSAAQASRHADVQSSLPDFLKGGSRVAVAVVSTRAETAVKTEQVQEDDGDEWED